MSVCFTLYRVICSLGFWLENAWRSFCMPTKLSFINLVTIYNCLGVTLSQSDLRNTRSPLLASAEGENSLTFALLLAEDKFCFFLSSISLNHHRKTFLLNNFLLNNISRALKFSFPILSFTIAVARASFITSMEFRSFFSSCSSSLILWSAIATAFLFLGSHKFRSIPKDFKSKDFKDRELNVQCPALH